MIINPIIPIWLMIIICIGLLVIKRKGIIPYIRQIVIVILLFAINLRIMTPGDVTTTQKKLDANIIFVIDSTISMNATDYGNDKERLVGVKSDCSKIIDSLAGSRFKVISFNSQANAMSPLTSEISFTKDLVNSIKPLSELYAMGSSLNVMKEALLNTAKQIKDRNNGNVTVFILSDGETTSEDELSSFKELGKYIDNGAVLGYGTQKGGKMKTFDEFTDTIVTVQDKTNYPYVDAISRIDENNLKQVAKDLGIKYINMNNKNNDLNSVISSIKKSANTTTESAEATDYEDTYYILLIPLLLLILYEIIAFKFRG